MIKETQTRKLTLTTQLLEMADYKATKLGLNFQEYIRFLISKDVESIISKFDRLSVEELMELDTSLDPNKNLKNDVAVRHEDLRSLFRKWKRSDKYN